MNSRFFDDYPRIPLFTTLLLFTITFFVYDDFGIRMILGYAVLMYVTLIYMIFRNSNIRFTRMKVLYLILSMNLTVLILIGKMDASSITFVMSNVLSAVVALIGDIRRTEMPLALKILIVFSIMIAVYVIAVRFRPSVYTRYVMPHISEQSRQANEWLLKDGYGITARHGDRGGHNEKQVPSEAVQVPSEYFLTFGRDVLFLLPLLVSCFLYAEKRPRCSLHQQNIEDVFFRRF